MPENLLLFLPKYTHRNTCVRAYAHTTKSDPKPLMLNRENLKAIFLLCCWSDCKLCF